MVYFTLTNIKKHYENPSVLLEIFPTIVWIAIGWENTHAVLTKMLELDEKPWAITKLILKFAEIKPNRHVHVVVDFGKQLRWSRATFDKLMVYHKTNALNHQTFKANFTYKMEWCGKTYRGKAHRPLWMWEKFTYCQIGMDKDYKQFFTLSKYDIKLPTWISGSTDCPESEIEFMKKNALKYANQKVMGTRKLPLGEQWIDLIYEKVITRKNYQEIMWEPSDKFTKEFRYWGVKNKDKIIKIIEEYEDYQIMKKRSSEYVGMRAGYRPFQEELAMFLDTPGRDRCIRLQCDGGGSGKSYFTRIEGGREDTLFISVAKGKDLAFEYNEKLHRRVVYLVPKGCMKYVAKQKGIIEAIKDGLVFSGKYKPKAKIASKPTMIVILGNEDLPYDLWTSDKLEKSWTSEAVKWSANVLKSGEALPESIVESQWLF